MSYYFPKEILTEILKRLSVKSLMRLRWVEKLWYSLIQSHIFITIHSDHRKNIPSDKCVLFAGSYYKVLSIRYDRKEECERYCLPYMLRDSTWHAISNGVVCLSTISLQFNDCDYYEKLYLWNPAIHKYITIPDPPRASAPPRISGVSLMTLAFGFVPKFNDYKIVKLIHDYHRVFIDVYTLSTSSWRIISQDNLFSHFLVRKRTKEVFVNGAAFWLGEFEEFVDIIVCFNTQNDGMLKISLPSPVYNDEYIDLSLGSFGDQSLALFVTKQGFTIDMWVLEELGDDVNHEVSWKMKRLTIYLYGTHFDFQVHGLIGNNCLILRDLGGEREFELDLYNLENNQYRRGFLSSNLLYILGFYNSRMVTLIPFRESLVLLNSVTDSNSDLPNLKGIGV